MRYRLFLVPFLLLLALIACRLGNPEAESPTNSVRGPVATLAPEEGDPAPALQSVAFTARAPHNTPTADTIYLLIMPLQDWAWLQHVPMTANGDGTYSASAELEQGALVRYSYDRWDESDWSRFKDTREAFDAAVTIENRYLFVEEGRDAVSDVIAAWADLPADNAQPTGVLRGRITDAATGEPIMDANLSIAGIHSAADYDGRFTITGLAPGLQRLTVYTTLGDYHMAAAEVEVPAGGEARLDLALEAADPVTVTFQVELPSDTPEEAPIRLVGNVYQLGARLGHPATPNQPDNHVLPVLERQAGADRATLMVDLYAGTYLQYYYTLASSGSAFERGAQGSAVYRSLVVKAENANVQDRVTAWRMRGENLITLRIHTPPNSSPGVPLLLQTGPSEPLTQVDEHEWVAYFTRFPEQEFRFRILQGDDTLSSGDAVLGQDVSPDSEDGWRTILTGSDDEEIEITVEQWFGNLAAAHPQPNELVTLSFNLSLPPNTPADEAVTLTGNHPLLADGIPMQRLEGNPWMVTASVALPAGEPISYRYALADGRSSDDHQTMPAFEGQVVNDWLAAWPGEASEAYGSRPDYISGFYIPDFWTTSFRATLASTFTRIREHNGGWVALSSVWHYGSFEPPVVEPRPVRAPSVLSLKEQIIDQAEAARQAGLKILLAPQFNMEMVAGGVNAVCAAQTDAWWFTWLEQAERLWMWNAVLAEQIGAEMLLLPGNCFHVFPSRGFFESEAGADEFDIAVAELIAQVREVYGGLILISGSTDFSFPALADINGVTTYDTGFPDLPATASVEEWAAAWDSHFSTTIDEIQARHGRPLMFYTIHAPNQSSARDPYGEQHQVRLLEGAFQAIANREWLAGSFTWDYEMIDAPYRPESEGLRARMAEAVLAKWYGIFMGE